MKERPPYEDDDVDEQYRRASARDASQPSESVRRAVLRRAAELATQRAVQSDPARSPTDQNLFDARRSGELDRVEFEFVQPAANEWRWRPAAYGGLAAAALAGLLIAPHFPPPSPPPLSASPRAVPSASKKTESAPMAPIEAPQIAAAETSPPASLPTRSAPGVAGPAMPANAMRARTLPPDATLAPSASATAGTSGASSAAASDAATDSTLEPRDKAAPALAAKPRAFSGDTPLNEIADRFSGGLPRSARPAPIDSATALRQAAQGGDTARLNALLDEHIYIDARDPAGRTALMLAVIGDQAQAVDALLARGADPNAADSRGTTPLAAALAANHADIIAALRRAGAH